MTSLKESSGDWTLDAELLVVNQVEQEPEPQVLATDAIGRRWDLHARHRRDGAKAEELLGEELLGQTISDVFALTARELRMRFSDGTALSVSPRGDAEA